MNDVKTYTILATIVGFSLIDDLTAAEQNALGGWLMLVAQLLQTNALMQQNQEQKILGVPININSKGAKQGYSPINNDYIDQKTLNELKKNVKIMQDRLNKL